MRRLAILMVVLFTAGCGGGGSSAQLSRADYTKQANASCAEAEKKLNALGDFANFDELAREMKVGQDALEQSADELRALKPPVQLAARHKQLVDLTDQTAELAGQLSIAAKQNDQVEMEKQAERADKLTIAANEVARKLGVLDCVAG